MRNYEKDGAHGLAGPLALDWKGSEGESSMSAQRKTIICAVAVIGIGVAWLLNAAGFMPPVEWVWTIGLALMGVLVLVINGLDKATAVVGPFLIIGALFSFLRQMGKIEIRFEAPILFLIFGVLLLISAVAPLKPSKWL